MRLRVIIAYFILTMVLCGCTDKAEENSTDPLGGYPMSDALKADYSRLDRPELLSLLFYPRSGGGNGTRTEEHVEDWSIPVAPGVSLGATLHRADQSAPVILFFHGNGEIVSDYEDLGPVYTKMGINFLAVDYRGYGRSSGTPTVSAMMQDCHRVFDYAKQRLGDRGYCGPIIVMGRSLGSASALELASRHQDEISGLIIESGFAYIVPLLRLIGVDTDRLGIEDSDSLEHVVKIQGFHKPVLIIHAEYDHIIPFSEGRTLFEACPSKDKTFLKIPGADHNTVFAYGMKQYLEAVKRLTEKVSGK
jgi:alpha-beta hydrolase superfamily lysophospholipase